MLHEKMLAALAALVLTAVGFQQATLVHMTHTSVVTAPLA